MGMRDEQESLDLIASQGTGVHAEQISIAALGTAEQFASFVVNRPFVVTFKSVTGNTGVAHIANTKAAAESGLARYELDPGEKITLKLGNVNEAWFKVTTNADVIQAIVETSTTLGN